MLPDRGRATKRLSRTASIAWIAVPPIVAVVLSLPCLGLGYFWDDFVFLTRVQADPIAALGPEGAAFYRPLSRAAYFWPLAWLGSSGAIVAHLVNLALLAVSITLLASLVRNLAGARAGMFAGLTFAALAPLPSLVAWASGSQDLLAITCTLAAFHLRNSGRNVGAGIAAGVGLLSKETVAGALPVLILWDWILGRRPARLGALGLGYGGLALAWGLIHPGIRGLASRGFGSGPLEHVGFTNLALSQSQMGRYLLALFNVPDAPAAMTWTPGRIGIGVAALALTISGVWLASRRGTPDERSGGRLSIARAAALAVLIAAPGIALPALLIQQWAAYFVCLPAIGTSIFIGVFLSRTPLAVAALAIGAFVGLGLLRRGTEPSDGLTERHFVEASRATRQVESGFRKLRPMFPREAQVLVSVASSGSLGIDASMHDGQAIRVWYRDPTIRTLRPERRLPHPRAEFLYRITATRGVVEIDPEQGRYRSSGGSAGAGEIRAITRTYARGLAASGETDRAVRILERLSGQDEDSLRSYDLRIAAMAFLAARDRARAEQILAKAPPISRAFALHGLARVMAEPTGRAHFDSCAYAAFGVSSSDPAALRHLMELFYASRFVPHAVHFARRLQEVAPGDSESAEILRELTQIRRRG
jgi:hypothetical protein